MSKFSTAVPKNATSLNESTGTGASPISGPPSASLGQRFFDEATLKTYQYVKVDTANNYAAGVTSAASVTASTIVATQAGALAYWGGDPANGIVVTYLSNAQNATTPANNANAVAGVFLGTVTSGNFTLIQTGGDATILCADAATVDSPGFALVSNTSTTAAAAGTTVGVAPGTAPAYRIVAYARNAGNASTILAYLVLDKDF